MQEEDILKIETLLIEPNDCVLDAPLNLAMKYKLLKPISGATWSIVYEADTAGKKKQIALHTSEPLDLAAGVSHEFAHTIPTITTEGVKEKYLLQVGVLKMTLMSKTSGENGEALINMMCQVTKSDEGKLMRSIMNPTEE